MSADQKKQVILMRGLGVSPGIVIGKVYQIERGIEEPAQFCYLDPSDIDREIERFKSAVKESRDQLARIKKKMEEDKRGKEHIRIIDAHMMILKDNMIINDTVTVIRREKVNVEWALKTVMNDIMDYFSKMDDAYMKERGSDIEHIINRVLVNLAGKKHETIEDIKSPSIIVSHDVTPADTAQMDKNLVLGFLTDVGGRTSHSSIMARALEIPAVVALENITRKTESGDVVIIDGTTGTVIVNPSDSVIEVYKKRKERYESYGKALLHYKDMPCETTDGRRIRLVGNMEIAEEMDSLLDHGAEGIGLYRTEFLYLGRTDMPNEEEHFKAYTHIARKMGDRVVTIRTLDLGGEKLHAGVVEKEINPALGLRAIRYCLKNTEVFKTQLRAILRASVKGRIRIMFPMISGIEELRQAKFFLEESKNELRAEGKPFDEKIEVGAMIEVPSAAVIADLITKEVDFISIGTNDLLQYTLAIDRVNEHVSYLYEPYHPAVLRMIRTVIEAANKAGISSGVCGELAGEPDFAILLLGFGVDQLSMSAFSVLKVKRLLRSINYADAKKISKAVMNFATAAEVENYLESKLPSQYGEEFFS